MPATASDGGAEEKNRTFFDVAPNPVCPIQKTFSFEKVFFLNKKSARVSLFLTINKNEYITRTDTKLLFYIKNSTKKRGNKDVKNDDKK